MRPSCLAFCPNVVPLPATGPARPIARHFTLSGPERPFTRRVFETFTWDSFGQGVDRRASGESTSTHEPCSHSGIARDWHRSGSSRGVTDCRGFVSTAEFGSFGDLGEALQITVASFRRRNSVRSGISARRYRLPWLRFVSDSRFLRGDQRDVRDYRGFVSSATLGSFGESMGRYRLPWVRFAQAFGAARA